MYYQGGGACWDAFTCLVPTCADTATEGDNPSTRSSGFADLTNEDNPFKDWHIVFVSYCTCDVQFGDTIQEYAEELTIEHRGYHNSRVVEKWARRCRQRNHPGVPHERIRQLELRCRSG